MYNHFHIADLISKKNKGTISSSESKELDIWVNENDENLKLYQKATDDQYLLDKLDVYRLFQSADTWHSIEDQFFATKTIPFFPNKLLRYAAILIPFLLVAAVAWYFSSQSEVTDLSNINDTYKPGTQKAILKLSDGGEVELDEKKPLAEFSQGDIQISNKQNLLSYQAPPSYIQSKQVTIYNELITPLGGTYRIKLTDETEVILNAGSTLRFPVEFTDSVRQVFLEGEAHFNVSHSGKPFIVNCNEMDISVLGTTFNISSYADDQAIKATLVEGKIKVNWNSLNGNVEESSILKPRDQAVLNKKEGTIHIEEVNTSLYTSWIRGKFEFDNDNLEDVMQKLARWYDFEYEFENPRAKDFHFTARFDNDRTISSILEMLQMTTDVKFDIRDGTIVVL